MYKKEYLKKLSERLTESFVSDIEYLPEMQTLNIMTRWGESYLFQKRGKKWTLLLFDLSRRFEVYPPHKSQYPDCGHVEIYSDLEDDTIYIGRHFLVDLPEISLNPDGTYNIIN
jgi:hypothetical protein